MNESNICKALKRFMVAGEPHTATSRTRFSLMGSTRREIFQHLCMNPCSSVNRISKATNRSVHTVEWHLRKLLDERYISAKKNTKRIVYYPLDLLEENDLILLETLNNQCVREVFSHILKNPGETQSEICTMLKVSSANVSKITKKLDSLKLIRIIIDGKFRRYYPSELLDDIRERNNEKIKGFKRAILDRLEYDGLNPLLIGSADEEIAIRITCGKEKAVLRLSCGGFANLYC